MSSSDTQTQDQRENNGSEDSTAMTVEYLRARLLSERSVSRAARMRLEELTKRVLELEDQLKSATLQRKRAEKATTEVLSILENHGISDVSEEINSSSDEEEIYESNNGSDITNGQEYSTSVRDGGVNSSSEVESSPSIGRTLSWKSGHRSQNSSQLKHIKSSRVRYSSFPPKKLSTNCMGKSCRRNRRQEFRSTVEVSPNNSSFHDDDASTACSNLQLQTMEEGSINIEESDTLDVQDLEAKLKDNQIANGYFLSEDGGKYQDIEGAVQHQEQLIGRYEAEENAQIEWEEKFRENNSCSPVCQQEDSLDPENNSDVTDERDDVKSTRKKVSETAITDPDKDGANNCSNEVSVPQELSLPLHINPSLQEKDGKISHEFSVPDAGTSFRGNSNQIQSENHKHIFASQGTSVRSCADDHSSGSRPRGALVPNGTTNGVGSVRGGCTEDSISETRSEGALVPNGTTNDVLPILEALQLAKFSLKQKFEERPKLRDGRISETVVNPSASVIQARNRVDIPGLGCPALFRLPTDLQCEATSRPNSSGSTVLSLMDYYPRIYSNKYLSSPYMDPKSTSTLTSGELHPRSAESISRLHPASSLFKSSSDTGSFSSTKFSDFDLPFTTYPFKASSEVDLPSSSRFTTPDLPIGRRVTYPVNHFSSDIIPRLPFDVTNLPSLHKNSDRLQSALYQPSHSDSRGLSSKTPLYINKDRNIGAHPAAHLSSNNQSNRNLHM